MFVVNVTFEHDTLQMTEGIQYIFYSDEFILD